MTEIALKDLRLKFHPTYRNSGGIYWEGREDWRSDCDRLGVILPVYNSGGVLNLLEVKPRDFSGDHGAIALGGHRNAGVKYHLLGGGSLTLKWFASYDKNGTSSSRTLLPSTSDETMEGSDSDLPDGFTPNPARISSPGLLLKGWESTKVPGIYSTVLDRKAAGVEG